jgi:hypothetical protein
MPRRAARVRWAKVDLEIGRLVVVQTLQRINGRLEIAAIERSTSRWHPSSCGTCQRRCAAAPTATADHQGKPQDDQQQ